MKKLSPKEKPANLKKSKQNIDEIGRTSQGGPRPKVSIRGRNFLKTAKTRQPKRNKYNLKEAMEELNETKSKK